MFFSVVICTHNRVDLLQGALASLVTQDIDADSYEIIVIDNASTDTTPDVVQHFQAEYPDLTIQYWYEEQVGLSHARNRGYDIAQGQYIAYLDDDARAPRTWLSQARQLIAQYDPQALGGGASPFYLHGKPAWFDDRYGTDRLTEVARFLQPDEPYIYGYNMLFPRAELVRLGGFDPQWGMCGRTLAYAEETDLLQRLWRSNHTVKVYYDPDWVVEHCVKPERMQLGALCRQRFIQGRYWERLQHTRAQTPRLATVRVAVQVMLLALWRLVRYGLWGRNKQQYPYWQNYCYEQTLERFYLLGILYEAYQQP
jgi:glycosyltransferase involved in cell wall biosynthesis